MKLFSTTCLALTVLATTAYADTCATGKTLTDGKLTIATGNPAYYPWVMDDAPESGQGFEAAVAYAVAQEMGFDQGEVVWVRSSFDEAIQPGAKNFDFNMQQYSITSERDQVVDFSKPYYTAPMAVLVGPGAVDTPATMAALKSLQWGRLGQQLPCRNWTKSCNQPRRRCCMVIMLMSMQHCPPIRLTGRCLICRQLCS